MNIDGIKALAQRAHHDAETREQLFATALHGKGICAYHAAWALTHLPKEDNIHICKHRDELVSLALETSNISLRRLYLALLERVEWSIDDMRTDLLDFCMEHMALPEETYGVQSLCMKLAYRQCRHYPELLDELRQVLLFMQAEGLGTGVRHTRNKILKMLDV